MKSSINNPKSPRPARPNKRGNKKVRCAGFSLPSKFVLEQRIRIAKGQARRDGLQVRLNDGRTVKIRSLLNRKAAAEASIVDAYLEARTPLLTRTNSPKSWSHSGVTEIPVCGETVYAVYLMLPDDEVSEVDLLIHWGLQRRKRGEPPYPDYPDATLLIYRGRVHLSNSRTGQLILAAAKKNRKPEVEALIDEQ